MVCNHSIKQLDTKTHFFLKLKPCGKRWEAPSKSSEKQLKLNIKSYWKIWLHLFIHFFIYFFIYGAKWILHIALYFNFTTLKGFKIIKLTTCVKFYNKKNPAHFTVFDSFSQLFLSFFLWRGFREGRNFFSGHLNCLAWLQYNTLFITKQYPHHVWSLRSLRNPF